jgi:ribosomal protein S18 acetylase RimI-like enzyme
MTFRIVAGDEGNWVRIADIYDADGYTRAADSIRERASSELEEFRAGDRVLWLAEAGGRTIGTVGLVFRGRDAGIADGVTAANINRLHVVQAQRRHGVATALIATAEAEARDRGFVEVTIEVEDDNVPALALYEKLGFEHVGRGTEENYLALRKPLMGD